MPSLTRVPGKRVHIRTHFNNAQLHHHFRKLVTGEYASSEVAAREMGISSGSVSAWARKLGYRYNGHSWEHASLPKKGAVPVVDNAVVDAIRAELQAATSMIAQLLDANDKLNSEVVRADNLAKSYMVKARECEELMAEADVEIAEWRNRAETYEAEALHWRQHKLKEDQLRLAQTDPDRTELQRVMAQAAARLNTTSDNEMDRALRISEFERIRQGKPHA